MPNAFKSTGGGGDHNGGTLISPHCNNFKLHSYYKIPAYVHDKV